MFYLYTDGACRPNPGRGAWAFMLMRNGDRIIQQGYEPHATNNKMELWAVLQGLRCFSDHPDFKDDQLLLYSDSKYIVDGIEIWRKVWAKNNWCKKNGRSILNKGVWRDIHKLADSINLQCYHVKGHSGHKYNEQVDELASQMIKKCS